MKSQIRPVLTVFVSLTILTGVGYPALVTGIGQILFRDSANGSLLKDKAGSALIGQPFDDAKYFWGRPSATNDWPYNGAASGGSNQGPTNPALLNEVGKRVKDLRDADPDQKGPIPVDLVTASASGLDPHISPAAAEYQVTRVAKARGKSADEIRRLVAAHTEGRTLGVLGEPRVNVLKLNLALDGK
jgi:potassium-transporting ATPase KdpC subunit